MNSAQEFSQRRTTRWVALASFLDQLVEREGGRQWRLIPV